MKSSLTTVSPQKREGRRQPDASAALNRSIQDQIGSRLRAMYDNLRTEPVPDRILDLLKHMEKSIERQSS
jgi:hypothetical protein